MKQLSLLLLLLLAVPAFAQEDEVVDPQAPVPYARYHGTLHDFDTIHFLCTTDRGGDQLTANACAVAESHVRRGAREADMDVAEGGKERRKGFTLSVDINSSGTVPRAIAIKVEASRLYKGAIDTEMNGSDPAREPRPGKLVFWERRVLAVSSGHGDRLENAVSSAIGGVMKDFYIWLGQQE